ncbi:MAG: polysaccharide biosynthesis/export family protein [Thermodesulfobacteriota bacterium]
MVFVSALRWNVLFALMVGLWFVFFMTQYGIAQDEDFEGVYTVNVGDVLDIQVWKEEELSRTVTVRRDGRISLNLIGDVQAEGRTPERLAEVVTQELSQFVEGPEVTVIVDRQGAAFYMIGEIATGEYPLARKMTLLQALALGGGFSEWADKERILLLRREKGHEKRLILDYSAIVEGEQGDDNILIQPGDTIVVQ